jgi:urea transport system substrate-binding protein
MSKKISRRSYLKYAGAAGVAAVAIGAGAYLWAQQTGRKEETINIAAFHAGSGACSALGVPWMRAEMLAVKHINEKGVKGFAGIKYIYYDNETSTAEAKRKFERMIQTEQVDFVVYGDCEFVDKVEVVCAYEARIPHMTGSQSGDILYGDVPLSHYYFAHDCTNLDQGIAAGETLYKLGAKKVGFIGADYDYGYLIYAGLNAFNAENGEPFEINPVLFTPLDKTDYTSEIAILKGAKLDALVCVYTGAGFLSLPKQIVAAGAKPDIVFYSGDWGSLAEAKLAGYEGMVDSYALVPTRDPTSSDWKKFVEAWRAEYGEDSYPSLWTEGAYQTMWAIKAAFEKAGTKDKETVKEVLRKNVWSGESGALRPDAGDAGPFTEWGQNLGNVQNVIQFREGASDLMPDFNLHQEVFAPYKMRYTFPEYKELARKYVPPEVKW